MNIQEAKREVINTVRAYTAKDEAGEYKIPQIRQRPVLLMGPPGIGKTAIVEQAAGECGVGLVSYTITHHTRQSAVGLPMVEKKIYDGREVTVTEYTMSEIIASVYDCMQNTGCREGILFIDEVNCVSETLAPTMLQFLQGKTFGNHRVPKGWVIVAAGNPQEYNKSVREFDIVTLDRVKKIDVDVDYPAWKRYAASREIHGAVRSYLEGKPQNFYRVEQNPDGKEFVTARGWEDLSVIMKQYEEMGVEIGESLIHQYLQCREISRDFASYYRFYHSRQEKYRASVERILSGENLLFAADGKFPAACTLDEQLTITNVLISRILNDVSRWREAGLLMARTKEVGQLLEHQADENRESFYGFLDKFFQKRAHALKIKEQAETVGEEEARLERRVDNEIKEIFDCIREKGGCCWVSIKPEFLRQIKERQGLLDEEAGIRADEMNRVLGWIREAFGAGTAFLTAMEAFTAHDGCMELIRQQGCPVYEENCGILMTQDRENKLRQKIEQMQGTELW